MASARCSTAWAGRPTTSTRARPRSCACAPASTRSIATIGKELGLLRSALRYMAKQRGPDGFKLYRYETDEIFPDGVMVTPLGQPLFPRWLNVRRDLEAACKRAGIAKVSPNDLRRTFASWQAEAGVPEAVTASLTGHTSSQMVRRVYGRIGSDAKRDAMAKLPPLAPAPGVMLSV